MRKVGSDEYREPIKQLKADKKQWVCGQGKQQRADRQSPKPDEQQRPATPAIRIGAWPRYGIAAELLLLAIWPGRRRSRTSRGRRVACLLQFESRWLTATREAAMAAFAKSWWRE
jgi:hypothetical protein